MTSPNSNIAPSEAESVLAIGVRMPRQSRRSMEDSLSELTALISTAGGDIAQVVWQELKSCSAATLLHSGKVAEIAELLAAGDYAAAVIDADLSPAQQRNLTDAWQCKVLDRTAIILDIFAQRAQSQAGKLQVELAQLEYRLPRLSGSRRDLMQQAGHIGARGPGESRLEIDRRRVRERITRLKKKIEQLRNQRATQRARRARNKTPVVALVGYTNAGKSTLLNRLTNAEVLAEDKLFATLDPTARQLRLPSGQQIVLIDTVGFINHLPHQLIAAFKSTFEEVLHADLLCYVLDASAENVSQHEQTVEQVLHELGADHLPILKIWNKIDLVGSSTQANGHGISARDGTGCTHLLHAIREHLPR